jgi:hypothetical protein
VPPADVINGEVLALRSGSAMDDDLVNHAL